MNDYSMDQLIQIAISLSTEKRISVLLDKILAEAMRITNCDGGTVYIREKDVLCFHNVVTLSKHVHLIRKDDEDILPPVPLDRDHICARAALEKRTINIPDAYEAVKYNLAGTRRYDQMNGYRTKSLLVVPMEDEKGANIGVLQLINAMDDRGEVVPFAKKHESVIQALGSLAAVSLNNTLLQRAVSDILHSFVMVMVDAIDARSPYNATHTRSMVAYARRFIEWLDTGDYGWRFQENEKDPFLMSVWLHDIGKLVIPLEIMDKRTRLDGLEKGILTRLEVARLMERLRALEHPQQAADAEQKLRDLNWAEEALIHLNQAGFLTEEMEKQVKKLEEMRCLRSDGSSIPLLTEEERAAVSVRRGTLTNQEREEMEKHVVYTRKLLSAMRFSGVYASVPEWASRHHELLNGSGYPDHLAGDQLPRQVRLLTILDIYDALTADDRPYKPPVPPENAFAILESMRDEGKVDGEILSLFRQSGAWRKEPA